MKRILSIILTTVLLLGALAACGTTPAETTPVTPTPTTPAPTTPAPTTPAPTTPVVTTPAPTTPATTTSFVTGTQPTPPPRILYFRSLENVRELKSMLDKDDATVKEYLRNTRYYMNGLRSKEDVIQMFEYIGNLNMLHLDPSSGYKLVWLDYCVDYNYIDYCYASETDQVRLICYIDPSEDFGSVDDADIIFTLTFADVSFKFVTIQDEQYRFKVKARIKTENSGILIEFTEDDGSVIENSLKGKLIFATLNELIEK